MGDWINANYETKTISWGTNWALEGKGELFNIMDEESAKEYLTQHNNYFKLTAYRKNYDKHPNGENKGK